MLQNAYILSTGTELSSGYYRDTNAPYLAKKLSSEGALIAGMGILPDNPILLKEGISHVLNRPEIDILILSGGLGPTQDDYTVDVLSSLWQKKIIEEPEALRKLQELCRRQPKRLNLESARMQVRIPEGGIPLKNRIGLAPGFLLEWKKKKGKCLLAAMPGVPREMELMFCEELLPILEKKILSAKEKKQTLRRVFYLYDTAESVFQEKFFGSRAVSELPKDFQWGVSAKLASIRIFFESKDEKFLSWIFNLARDVFPDKFIEKEAQELLHNLCLQEKLKIAVAESCTGGWIGKLITDFPGSSAYFQGGIISYANEVKKSHLDVPVAILGQEGAVSEKCVLAMAEGLLKKMDADYSLSISGIAGPDGGSSDKPIGTVHIGFASKNGRRKAHKLQNVLDRNGVRSYAADVSLFYFYKFICENTASRF